MKILNKLALAKEAMEWIESQNIVTLQYWDDRVKGVDLFEMFFIGGFRLNNSLEELQTIKEIQAIAKSDAVAV
jgi:hypothetical protein